jgi:hypothetical protein
MILPGWLLIGFLVWFVAVIFLAFVIINAEEWF